MHNSKLWAQLFIEELQAARQSTVRALGYALAQCTGVDRWLEEAARESGQDVLTRSSGMLDHMELLSEYDAPLAPRDARLVVRHLLQDHVVYADTDQILGKLLDYGSQSEDHAGA